MKVILLLLIIQFAFISTTEASGYTISYVYENHKASDYWPERLLFVFKNNHAIVVKYNEQSQFLLIDFVPCNKYWSNMLVIDNDIAYTASYFVIHLSEKRFVLFDCYNIERFSIKDCEKEEKFIEPKEKYLLSFDKKGSVISYAYYFDLTARNINFSPNSWLNEYFADNIHSDQLALKVCGLDTPISQFLSNTRGMFFSLLQQKLKYFKEYD